MLCYFCALWNWAQDRKVLIVKTKEPLKVHYAATCRPEDIRGGEGMPILDMGGKTNFTCKALVQSGIGTVVHWNERQGNISLNQSVYLVSTSVFQNQVYFIVKIGCERLQWISHVCIIYLLTTCTASKLACLLLSLLINNENRTSACDTESCLIDQSISSHPMPLLGSCIICGTIRHSIERVTLFWVNKEKLPRAGFHPRTTRLIGQCSTNWAVLH